MSNIKTTLLSALKYNISTVASVKAIQKYSFTKYTIYLQNKMVQINNRHCC